MRQRRITPRMVLSAWLAGMCLAFAIGTATGCTPKGNPQVTWIDLGRVPTAAPNTPAP